MILKLETITEQREQQMDVLWQEFQAILSGYMQRTEEKHSEYVQLRDRDNEDTKHIREHYIEIARATETIVELKTTLETVHFEHDMQVDQLKNYKRLLQEKQKQTKLQMEAGLKLDKERMRQLVVSSVDVIKVF